MKEGWTRADRFALIALFVGVLSFLAAVVVVPEIRRMLRLERDAENERAKVVASNSADDAPVGTGTSSVLPPPKGKSGAVGATAKIDDGSQAVSSRKESAKSPETHVNGIRKVRALDGDGRESLVRLHIDRADRGQGDDVDTVIRVYNDTTQPVMLVPFCDAGSEGPFSNVDSYFIESTKGQRFVSYTYGTVGSGKYRGCMKAELAPGESFAFEFNFSEVENLGRPLKLVHRRTSSDRAEMMAEMAKQPMKTLVLLDFSVPIVVPEDYR